MLYHWLTEGHSHWAIYNSAKKSAISWWYLTVYLRGRAVEELLERWACNSVTWDQALLYFFASLVQGGKNNAWYIHLTSRQPPRNLHNLTTVRPVMLLANQRLQDGNQILARIMSLLKSILGKRELLSTSMFIWGFLKKFFNVLFFLWNTACWSCRTFI